MADKQYKRQLILHSNAYPVTHTLTVKVQTAALPIEKREVPYAWLTGVLLINAIAAMFMTWLIAVAGLSLTMTRLIAVFGLSLTMTWLIAVFGLHKVIELLFLSPLIIIFGVLWGSVVAWMIAYIPKVLGFNSNITNSIWLISTLILSVVFMWYMSFGSTMMENEYRQLHWSIVILNLLTSGLGTSFGILCIVGLTNPYILFVLAGTGLCLVSILLYSPLKRRRLITKYRQSEMSLIKP